MSLKIRELLILCFLCFILSGCWDADQLERLYYAYSVGVDYKEEQYHIYVQILNFSSLAKVESGGNTQQSKGWVGNSHAQTIDKAFHNLYRSSQNRIYWGHLSSIVFTEGALKKGIKDTLDLMQRYNEIRSKLWIYSTTADIQDLLTTSPILNESPVFSQIGDPEKIKKQSSVIFPIKMYRVISKLNEPANQAQIPNFILVNGEWADENKKYTVTKMNGMSVLDNNYKFKAYLKQSDINGLKWFDKTEKRIPLTVYNKQNPQTEIIITEPKHTIKPIFKDNKVEFDINIKATGRIITMEKPIKLNQLDSEVEGIIKKQIQDSYLLAFHKGVDIYNLLPVVYKYHNHEWKKLMDSVENKVEILSEDSIRNLHVQIDIEDGGENKVFRP